MNAPAACCLRHEMVEASSADRNVMSRSKARWKPLFGLTHNSGIMPVVKTIYLAIILIAALTSLVSFRTGLPLRLKLFAWLLGLTFIVEVYCRYFYYTLIEVKILRRIIFLFLWIFPIFWLATVVFLFGLRQWNTYVTVVGSFFSILFALMYYYQLITAKEIQPIRHLPEFWIATGMLIFYLWELPYSGTLNFFLDYYVAHRTVSRGLLTVRLILDTLMYAMFCYGYLCQIINTRKYLSS
jgi:hypothetical protein